MFKLPVWVRRELGMKVNGPKPGFKRAKAKVDTVQADGMRLCPSFLTGQHLPTLGSLAKGNGVLVQQEEWKAKYRTVNCAQASIRSLYPKATFSIRTVLDKGAKKDLLIIRVA